MTTEEKAAAIMHKSYTVVVVCDQKGIDRETEKKATEYAEDLLNYSSPETILHYINEHPDDTIDRVATLIVNDKNKEFNEYNFEINFH